MNFYRAFSLLLYKRKKVMIKNILTNLKIEQLNAMQEAAIDTWNCLLYTSDAADE